MSARGPGRVAKERPGERGVVAVVVAVLIVVLLAFVALAVDVGYLCVTKNQLQDTADAAALAAARKLGNLYQNMSYEAQQTYAADADRPNIVASAQGVANQNQAAGKAVALLDGEVILGRWKNKTFTPNNVQPDAVRVVARRDGTANGAVNTFFARVVGFDSFTSGADAVAALTGQSTAGPGDLELPIGISRYFFDNLHPGDAFCDKDIQFSPSNSPDSCAGWTTFNYGSNDANLRDILKEKLDSPTTTAGESEFNFVGGDMSQQSFDALLELFRVKGFDVDANWDYLLVNGQPVHQATLAQGGIPLTDAKTGAQLYYDKANTLPRNRHKWETGVLIYDRGDCTNPNQSIKIVGFAQIELTDVVDAGGGPNGKTVRGRVKCNYVGPEDNRGGGGEYGLKGSVPGLVE